MPSSAPTPIEIISLNAWGGTMFAELIDWLPGSGADVYCFQEVTRTDGLDGWTRFDDADRSLPQRANLFDDLRAALPDHRAYFAASDAGPVKVADGTIHRQDFGLAMFVAERFTPITEAARFVHGDFTAHETWPVGGRPRIAQAIRLADADDRTMTVANLHGLRDPAGKDDTPARIAQAKQLAALVVDVRGPDDTTVVCGDLNVLPESETFAILGEIGLVDLVGDADTRTSRYAKPTRHANYLLTSDPDRVMGLDIMAEPEVSDHRILRVRL